MDHRSNSISRHNYNDNNNGSYQNTNVNQGGGNDGKNNRNAFLNPQNSMQQFLYDITNAINAIIKKNTNSKYLINSLDRKIKTMISNDEYDLHLCFVDKANNGIFISPDSPDSAVEQHHNNAEQLKEELEKKQKKRNEAADEMNKFYALFAGAKEFMFSPNRYKNRLKRKKAPSNPTFGHNQQLIVTMDDVKKVTGLLDDCTRQGLKKARAQCRSISAYR